MDPKEDPMKQKKYEHTILLLQGGGALGAYQAGAYEGLAEAGILPDWIVGVSIGSINGTIIAGNPPERRVERLREFWDRMSSYSAMYPPAWFHGMRSSLCRMSAATVATFGIQGFFTPRLIPPVFALDGNPGALSIYNTEPLRTTLEELVDFDLINRRDVRLSLGAANVQTGDSHYFDNHSTRIGPDHTRASGALPPSFPPVEIEGEYFWDGGIVSNSPIWYVSEQSPNINALIVQVDLFSARGELPENLDDVQERAKDIQYSSKTRFSLSKMREQNNMRTALGRVLAKLPPDLKNDPDVLKLAPLCKDRQLTLAHLINRRRSNATYMKDYEFSRQTINEGWQAGLEDVRLSVANKEWLVPTDLGFGMKVYYLPPTTSASPVEKTHE